MNDRTDLQDSTAPWWQPAPCPSWCVSGHLPNDQPEDRKHWGDNNDRIQLTLLPLADHTPMGPPPTVVAYLEQHVREVEPRIVVAVDELRPCMDLTLAEAGQLESLLRDLLFQSRASSRG